MIMEFALKTALEKAVSVGAQNLDEALKEVARTKKYNIASCIKFLEAARTAVLGLEDEVDEIFIEAGLVARHDWDNKSELFKRVDSYINRDRLRPVLDGSLNGISACYKFASLDADGFLQRKERRERKTESLGALLRLLGQLSGYLNSLSQTMHYNEVNYTGPSGLDLEELLPLRKLLDDFQSGMKETGIRKQEIIQLVEKAQQKRQRRGLPLAANTKRVIQELTVAFRLEMLGTPATSQP